VEAPLPATHASGQESELDVELAAPTRRTSRERGRGRRPGDLRSLRARVQLRGDASSPRRA